MRKNFRIENLVIWQLCKHRGLLYKKELGMKVIIFILSLKCLLYCKVGLEVRSAVSKAQNKSLPPSSLHKNHHKIQYISNPLIVSAPLWSAGERHCRELRRQKHQRDADGGQWVRDLFQECSCNTSYMHQHPLLLLRLLLPGRHPHTLSCPFTR